MTKMMNVNGDSTNFFPVVFRLYKLYERDVKSLKNGITTIHHKKGEVNEHTIITLNMKRNVTPGKDFQTVGDIVNEVKGMFEFDANFRFSIISAKETDGERDAYRRRMGLAVVDNKEIIQGEVGKEVVENVPITPEPVRVVNDEEITGEIKTTRKSVKRIKKEAA